MRTIVCWNCGASLDDIPRPISRHSQCSACFNELHCCRLCRHFDSARTTTCHEDRADPPMQKENANFCDFFAPRADAFEGKTAQKSSTARGELEAMFGKELDSANDAPDARDVDDDDPRKKLDDLFKS